MTLVGPATDHNLTGRSGFSARCSSPKGAPGVSNGGEISLAEIPDTNFQRTDFRCVYLQIWTFYTAVSMEHVVALTSLSNGNRIKNKLADVGISARQVCAISGISAMRLSDCMRGVHDLPVHEAATLHTLLDKLADLQRALGFPLLFADAGFWRKKLQEMRDQDVTPAQIAEAMDKVFNSRVGL